MDNDADICPLCGRALGRRREAHHVVPKSKGGRARLVIHSICHRKIHHVFSNQELARFDGDLDAVKAHPDMLKFIQWVARKPPDFHAPTRSATHSR